jgi:diguanylate cyclase (GGDEF)-like protein
MTSGLLLAYVEHELGREAVKSMLGQIGLADREQELRDENSWISFEDKIALFHAAAQVTGDPHVTEHMGAAALELSVGLGIKRALRALGSPEFVYGNVARANRKFNWSHSLELVQRDRDRAKLEYRDLAGVGYDRYDCDYTIGLLRVVPQLFGLPPARIAHPVCGARGADRCEYDVHWVGGLQRIKRTSIVSGALAAAVTGAGAFIDPQLLVAGLGLAGVSGVVAGARATSFMRNRIRALETLLGDRELVAESQLSSLAALSSELRLDEVLDRILASAQEAIAGTQFAVLIDEDGRMRADRHSNIPEASLRVLEQWAEEERQSMGEGLIVIDDLTAVPSLEAIAGDSELPLGSLCAAPLNFRGALLGVLLGLTPGPTVFLPHDIRMLETYAGHAAIALSNARLVVQLEREATEDPLTGLANQRVFRLNCAAEQDRAAREDRPLALVIFDLDHFKSINDRYGHPFGNHVLISVADALRSVVRAHDTVARIGGEEFALLLPGADEDEGRAIVERALARIAAVRLPEGDLSCSAGIASARGSEAPEADLFDAADRALYEAKRDGRGRAQVASQVSAGASGR